MPKLDLDDFLEHSTGGGRGEFLSRPKDWPLVPGTKPPVRGVNVVLHREDAIHVLWRHGVPRVVEGDDGEKKVWGGNYICQEDEDVIVDQYRLDDDDRRVSPPQTCGICKMIDWVRNQIVDGAMDWTDEIFKFEADDARQTRVVHAGGICNLFGKRNMNDDEKAELKSHGIYVSDAWMENGFAKANYLFLVVDYDDPKAGVQIAIEKSSLGDKMKVEIADRRMSRGVDEGNPFLNPVVFQWTYNEKAKTFNDIYHVNTIEKLPITDEVKKLIDGPAPVVDNLVRPFDNAEVLASLKLHALVEMPWDEFFGDVQEGNAQEKIERQVEAPVAKEKPKAEKKAGKPTTTAVSPQEEELFGCDTEGCEGDLRLSDPKCPKCGRVYIEEKAKEEPKARRKRGEVQSQPPPVMPKAADSKAASPLPKDLPF